MTFRIPSLLSVLLSLSCLPALSAAVTVVDLTCEYSADPLGIDKPNPRLFWRLESSERGAGQTAWQVLVASSLSLLESGRGDCWDSGKLASTESTHIPYAGRPLLGSEQVFWKVRVWDMEDRVSGWSEIATWTMGQLHPEAWTGVWIGAPARSESVLLRKEFEVKGPLQRALVHVSGLGHYELSLNGQKAGGDLLTPGWTHYSRTTLYDTRDITAALREGRNAVGLILGNGMYHVERRNRFAKFVGSYGPKRAIADIILQYADGRVEVIGTDETWQAQSGPITFSSIFGGEDHDARLEADGWNQSGFKAAGWKPAVAMVVVSKDTLKGHEAGSEPLRPIEVRQPVEVRQLAGPGAFLYDFGQNASYMPRLTVSGPAGSVVRLVPGERLFPDGHVCRASMGGIHRGTSWWEYVKGTDEAETWFPKFFYSGSRYLQTQAIPAQPDGERPRIESLEGVIVHAAARPLGQFETSNPLLNQIRELVRWAQRSNMVSVLTDCPHREKLGWLEQYHLNGPAIRYEFDVARIYTKGMQDMADAQTPDGLIPNIAPEFTRFSGTFRAAAEWGAAFIAVPWQQYLFNGDLELIRRHYPEMKRYFRYLEGRADNLILSEGLGDWFDLGPKSPPGRAQLTPPPVTATAFFYQDAILLSRMAGLLGLPEEAEAFVRQAAAIRERYNAAFYNPEEGTYATNSQAANALPLVMGLVEEENRPRVLAALLDDVVKRGYSMTAGDVGFRYLLLALSDGGHDEAIYRMINQDETPGYGYQIRMGATALTEAWDANPVTSNNHFMLGHITEWFYSRLLGIAPDPDNPGFRHVLLDPRPVGDLERVRGSYDSLHGPVSVEWRRDGGTTFAYDVDLPPNTTATLRLPASETRTIRENGRPLNQVEGCTVLGMDGQRALIELTAGQYRFTSTLDRAPH